MSYPSHHSASTYTAPVPVPVPNHRDTQSRGHEQSYASHAHTHGHAYAAGGGGGGGIDVSPSSSTSSHRGYTGTNGSSRYGGHAHAQTNGHTSANGNARGGRNGRRRDIDESPSSSPQTTYYPHPNPNPNPHPNPPPTYRHPSAIGNTSSPSRIPSHSHSHHHHTHPHSHHRESTNTSTGGGTPHRPRSSIPHRSSPSSSPSSLPSSPSSETASLPDYPLSSTGSPLTPTQFLTRISTHLSLTSPSAAEKEANNDPLTTLGGLNNRIMEKYGDEEGVGVDMHAAIMDNLRGLVRAVEREEREEVVWRSGGFGRVDQIRPASTFSASRTEGMRADETIADVGAPVPVKRTSRGRVEGIIQGMIRSARPVGTGDMSVESDRTTMQA